MTGALSYLFDLEQFGIKFGLDNITALVDRLGRPDRAFHSVHIAGTNGKGSVTAMIDAALRAAGYRSARYTSPHLIDIRERFVIDGRPVSAQALDAAIVAVRAAADSLRACGVLKADPTYFEVTTAVAFELFREAAVDIAVLEVGLGGRLDATNVVSPIVTAITTIAFDHEQYLGSTLADIAREKAGIIKPGVPVVVGDIEPEAMHVIEQIARDRGAPVVRARQDRGLAVGLRGMHQLANAAVAVGVIDVLNGLEPRVFAVPAAAVATGLAQPAWPGRLDLRQLSDGREILLDAAHNPAGARALASYLQTSATMPLVFAVMQDKDVGSMLQILLPAVDRLVLTRASNRRSADPAELARLARAIDPEMAVSIEPSPAAAIAAAWRMSPRIVAAGSIFLLGDVMKEIG